MRQSLAALTAVEIFQKIDTQSIAVTEVLDGVIKTAQKTHDLNALHYFDADAVQHKAHSIPKGKLHGVPFVAKDNIHTDNMPTSGGTMSLESFVPDANAPVIDRLLKEGAILIGKANLHELAFGITSNNATTGAVRNPYDTDRIAGGSSGGTAAAVAVGIVPFGLGTDTGGSCRIPAALCGVVGFRPSTGRYPSEGIIPISHTRDTVGTLARSVADVVLIDEVLAGGANVTTRSSDSIRLGLDRSMLCNNLEPEVATVFKATIEKLQAAGVTIADIDLSQIWDHNAGFSFPVVLYEIMRDLPNHLARYAPHLGFEKLIANIKSPDVLDVLQSQMGEDAITQAAYDEAMYVHRPKMLEIYRSEVRNLDGIIFPTTPLRASKIGEDKTVHLNGQQVPTFPTFIRNTDIGSNLGVPCISIPAKVNGLPIGIEIDGKVGADEELLSVALSLEPIITT